MLDPGSDGGGVQAWHFFIWREKAERLVQRATANLTPTERQRQAKCPLLLLQQPPLLQGRSPINPNPLPFPPCTPCLFLGKGALSHKRGLCCFVWPAPQRDASKMHDQLELQFLISEVHQCFFHLGGLSPVFPLRQRGKGWMRGGSLTWGITH